MRKSDLTALAELPALLASGEARALRFAANLSQELVGQHVGATGSAVCMWEKNRRTPRGRVGLRYARLLQEIKAHQPEQSGSGAVLL